MERIEIEKIEEMLRGAVFRNDEHKQALKEKLFGDGALDDDELLLVAGGTHEDENIDDTKYHHSKKGD